MNSLTVFYMSFVSIILASCGPAPKVTVPQSTVPAILPATPTETLKITSISPSTSTTAGGTTLTVNGALLQSGTTVLVGTFSCNPVTLISPAQLTCPIPAHAAGTVGVTVTNPGGATVTLASALVYADMLAAPSIASSTPASGSTFGGNIITIAGANFQTGATVKIDGVVCTVPNVTSATSMTCRTPSHALGIVNIVVQNPDAQMGTLTSGFNFVNPPSYTSLKADILTPKCSGCHGGAGGFFTQTYSQIITRVVPGDPLAAGSKLYLRTADGTMPPGGPPLTAAELQKIYDWIFANAPDN